MYNSSVKDKEIWIGVKKTDGYIWFWVVSDYGKQSIVRNEE